MIETEIAGGPLHELRVVVPNRPGIVAEVALELGRAGVNIEDMALYPAADMTSGAISLYIAGDEEAERAEQLVRELGHDVSRRANDRMRSSPLDRCAGSCGRRRTSPSPTAPR